MHLNFRNIAPVYRLNALRVASAFRTVSENAVCVITEMLTIEELFEELQAFYLRKELTKLSSERKNALGYHNNGGWTYLLIPQVILAELRL